MTKGISERRVLVTGGTGKTGRRVVQRLQALGADVRVGSRAAAIPFDWENPGTWRAALADRDAAYVSFQPDLAVPGALATVTAFFKEAAMSGVRKLVLLSGRGEPECEEAEHALQSGNVDWTILRASWFNQNFSESFFLEPLRSGELVLPTNLAPEPFIDAEDIADIALAALIDDDHAGRLHVLTGPEAIGFDATVARIAAATGRSIAFTEVPPEAYRAALIDAGLPKVEIDLVMYLFTTVLDGRNVATTDGVEQALGRPARSFEDYVGAAAATGVWGGTHD